MAQKPVNGVAGVLGELISMPAAAVSEEPAEERTQSETVAPTTARSSPPTAKKSRARVGRPPGKSLSQSESKEKLTIRVDSDLAATYRDWSWEARCQVGELIQQALRRFLSQRQK